MVITRIWIMKIWRMTCKAVPVLQPNTAYAVGGGFAEGKRPLFLEIRKYKLQSCAILISQDKFPLNASIDLFLMDC